MHSLDEVSTEVLSHEESEASVRALTSVSDKTDMAYNASASHEGDATNGRIENAIEQLQSTKRKIHQEGEWAENFHWYDDRVDELDDAIELLESTDDGDDLPEITRHVEAPEYGGETYARCEGCGVESISGPNHILHDEDCPHSEVRL